MSSKAPIDALFIGAHPDDCELLAGGLMARMVAEGARVTLADATQGEMGTRGTPEIRKAEARRAAEILGVDRINLGLADGGIGVDLPASVRTIVRTIRELRPRLVFTHTGTDHHPDHNALHVAVRQAMFFSNAAKYDTGNERFAPEGLHFFWSHRALPPPKVDYIVDITPFWEQKLAALKAHESQINDAPKDGLTTYLTNNLVWHRLSARFGYYGSLVNVAYGEPYLTEGCLRVDNPLTILKR